MNARSLRCAQSRRPARLLLVLASSALLLTGCSADKLASFQAGDAPAGEPRLLPKFCEGVLQIVPPPAVTRKTDAGVAFRRTADALDEANDRIAIGGMCAADERTQYAGPKEAAR